MYVGDFRRKNSRLSTCENERIKKQTSEVTNFRGFDSIVLPVSCHNYANPLPSLPKGRGFLLFKQDVDLKTHHVISTEKNSTPCPLHLERGKPTRRLIVSIWVRSFSPVFSHYLLPV